MANDTSMLTGGITQEVYNVVNSKYSKVDKIAIANKFLKGAVSAKDAIVNLLGNTGIAGFKFNLPQTEQVKFESEITDYYTDLNTPVNEHIVRKPITITMTGLQGEYFYSVNKIEDMLALVTPTFSLVKQFLPQLTTAAKQTIIKRNLSTISSVETIENTSISSAVTDYIEDSELSSSAITKAIETTQTQALKDKLKSSFGQYQFNFNAMDLFTLFQNLYKLKSAQTRAFLFFEALWKSQAPFSVETTWKRFDNMVIQSVIPMRDNNADVSEFTVVVKQLNFTQSKTESLEAAAGRMKQQAAAVSDKGVDKGEEVTDV